MNANYEQADSIDEIMYNRLCREALEKLLVLSKRLLAAKEISRDAQLLASAVIQTHHKVAVVKTQAAAERRFASEDQEHFGS